MIDLNAAIRDVPMPARMRKLPVNEKGFPVPAFVAWLNLAGDRYLPEWTRGARRDFRVINPDYLDRCYRLSKCWICGEPLGRHRVFAIGPMCAVNRTTMEPPSHRDCVEYATKTCPFMMRPRMVRNYKDMPSDKSAPGVLIERNPGVYCLWETETYRRFRAPGGLLCAIGEPQKVEWVREGRPATRAEVVESIDSGMPLLTAEAMKEGPEALADLTSYRARVERYLPKEIAAQNDPGGDKETAKEP